MTKLSLLTLLSISILILAACGGSSSAAEVTGTIILPEGATMRRGQPSTSR